MTSHAADRPAETDSDPFSTKGGSVFVESLASMVLTPASRSALGDAVARGRHRRVDAGPEAHAS